MSPIPIHLASSSPRRREILKQLGLSFSAAAVDVDETPHPGETADVLVLRLAAAKTRCAGGRRNQVVIAADTAVVLDGVIFGKPRDRDDALRMLGELSGRWHRVVTGVAVLSAGTLNTAMSSTDVLFREIRPDEALAYWHSGEPGDKAGAYAVQGRGGVFVESLHGSYSGVVGLPVFETANLLARAGVDVFVHERQET